MSRKFPTIVVALLIIITLGYVIKSGYQKSWTGFQGYVSKGEFVPPKKLWDWMDLLVVPLGLAVAAFYLNKRQKESELSRTNNQQREASLQAFITELSDLLLNHNLRTSKSGDGVQTIARARALTVLKELDGKRKGLAIRFLVESQLIQRGETTEDFIPKISLRGADLTGADLSQMNLSNVVFDGVDLTHANFELSNIMKMERDVRTKLDHKWDLVWRLGQLLDRPKKHALRGQDLRNVDLTEVDLHKFDLRRTDLRGAILNRADLSETKINFWTKFDTKWRHIWKAVNDKSDNPRFSGNLSYANFAYRFFRKQDLSKCDFEGALFRAAEFVEVNMKGLSAFNADFSRANVADSDLSNARLALASFAEATLTKTAMIKADLTWANLQSTVFRDVDLTEADLQLSNLCGADLSGAKLKGAKFRDSDFDEHTKWPAGFDPTKTAGLKPADATAPSDLAHKVTATMLLNIPD